MKSDTSHNEGIIRPVKGKSEPCLGTDALMVMIPSELTYLVRYLSAEEIVFNNNSLFSLYGVRDSRNRPLALAGPFFGAPHAVAGMEKLIALGARRIWAFGWCGSLQPDIKTGHLIIPTGAISEEGTSRHYPIGQESPETDKRLNNLIEAELSAQGLSYRRGPVWTTDAIYRETPDKVRSYRKKGVLAVEMEIAALITVALYRSVALAALLVVSDELHDLRWRPGFSNPRLKKNSHSAGRTLLNIACGMS